MNSVRLRSASTEYNYADPFRIHFDTEPLLGDLISTAAFQRLRDIRFLGSIDYWLIPSPNGTKANIRYTRFQHSLGVARLALMYAEIRGLPERSRQLASAAALLHDIGHAPFSHSMEAFFENEFGINHHTATERIISGETILGYDVAKTLRNYNIDPDEVISILNGGDELFDGFFSGPINFDTIEGILRSREYISPYYISPRPTDVLYAAINRESRSDQHIVDSFWRYKHEIYQFIVKSPSGVVADYLSQEVCRKNASRITENDFFSTEKKLLRKIPELRTVLYSPQKAVNKILNKSEPIEYNVRRFFLNLDASFFDRDDRNRYKQSKNLKLLQTYFLSAELANKGKRHSAGSLRTGQSLFR